MDALGKYSGATIRHLPRAPMPAHVFDMTASPTAGKRPSRILWRLLYVAHFYTGPQNAEMFFSPNSRKRSRLTKACLIHVGNSHISVIFIRLRYYYRAAEQPALITPRLIRLPLSLRQERHLANSMFNPRNNPIAPALFQGGRLQKAAGRPPVSFAEQP